MRHLANPYLGGNNDASKNPRHEAFAQELARGLSASAAKENAFRASRNGNDGDVEGMRVGAVRKTV